MKTKSLSILLSCVIAFNPLLVSASQFPNIIRLTSPVTNVNEIPEHWVSAEPVFTAWQSGKPYACSAWLPSPSSYVESAEFQQMATDCSVDSSRTRQNREIETRTGKYRDVGLPVLEEVTYTSQSATRDYRISYSPWADQGAAYGCSNWTPDPISYPVGAAFTQTADDCELDQAQTRTEFSRFDNGGWVSEGSESFTRTLTSQAFSREAVGVAELPSIALNSASSQVFAGEPFDLSWLSSFADKVQLRADQSNSGISTTDFEVTGSSYSVTPSAAGTFTYTATAFNSADQVASASRTITALNGPVISSFTADKTQVAAGGTVTLSWSSSGADTLSINNGVGTVTGTSKLITVGAQSGLRIYTLTSSKTLNNVEKTAEQSVQLDVVAAPSLAIVSAPSTSVFANAAFGLSWAGTDAVSYAIRGNVAASGVSVSGTSLAGDTSLVITPTAPGTYTYTVTATNSVGVTASTSQTVTVMANPTITSFTSDTATITAGGNITLSWVATGGGALSINQGVGSVTGTGKVVAVGATVGNKTYTLTSTSILNGVTRTATRDVMVSVVASPTIAINSAPATDVFANVAFTLGWSATGATNYKIRGNVAASGVSVTDVDVGTVTSRTITPTAAGTYTYTVTATNAAGVTTSATRSVTVVADPVVSAFTATPSTVTVGANTTLAWTTTGSSLSINQSVGTVTGSSKSVAVGTTAGSKTYTLTSSRTLNGVTRSATASATVNVVASPVVSINTAPSTNVFANAAFTLGWTATGTTNYKIKGSATASGLATTDLDIGISTSRLITPTAVGTYTYTITATNAAGATATATRSITVVADPVVSAFTASPATVALGGNTTLSWMTTGATSLSINQGIGAVTGSSVFVPVGTGVGNKTYTLTASATLNGITRTATRSSAVTVVASCSYSFTSGGDASTWKFFADGNSVWTGSAIPGVSGIWFAVDDLRIPFSDPVQYNSGLSKVSNVEFRYNTGSRIWRIYRGAYIGNVDGFVMYQVCVD